MIITRPLINDSITQSALDIFDIPVVNYKDYESSLQTDFGLDSEQSKTTITISLLDRQCAVNFARRFDSELSEVSVSQTMYSISEIIDISGTNVFNIGSAIFGWLIFVDLNIFANWGHKCKYFFYVDDDTYEQVDSLMPPASMLDMEVI